MSNEVIPPDDVDWRAVVDTIHAILCVPYDWSSDTPQDIANVLMMVGYNFPDEGDDVTSITDRDRAFALLGPYRPEERA